MQKPDKWTPGKVIRAEDLNRLRSEAMLSRNAVNAGAGSAMVNESMGNQSNHLAKQGPMLCVAIEDFAIPGTKTDLYSEIDAVPSGRCVLMRLNLISGEYTEEGRRNSMRVYDVIAGLDGSSTKIEGDSFYVTFNEDSQRYEIIGGGGGNIIVRLGIVCRCLPGGWYVVELSNGMGQPPIPRPECEGESDSMSDSESASGFDPLNCTDCGILETECGEAGGYDSGRITESIGEGTFAFAKDYRSVPLKIGGEVVLTWLGDVLDPVSDSVSDSASDSASVSDSGSDEVDESRKLWVVLSGEYQLVTIPHDVWECCPDGSGIRKVSCMTFIVEGSVCVGPEDPCPEPPGPTE